MTTTQGAGRTVVVIGSSSAIGLAITARFLSRGDRVVGVSLTAADELCDHLVADCSDPAQVERVFEEVLRRFDGRIDVLVSAAALNPRARAVDQTDEMWRTALGATLDSAFYSARAALPHMPPGGAVVAVSSVMASHVSPGVAGYAAAKGGLEALVRVLALEHGAAGIRVNAVAPGPVWTPLNPADQTAEKVAQFGKSTEYKRPAQPEELSPAYVFLASPVCSSYITGIVLPITGSIGGG